MSHAEERITQLLAHGDRSSAAVLTIRTYGPEILGFLVAQLRDDQLADEVFSVFAEDLWRGMAQLELRTTMRAFAYALARNAKHRFLARDLRKQRRARPLSDVPNLSELAAEVRTATAPYVATSTKNQVQQLRERLTPEEQELLTLRLDRGLSWVEIAAVVGDPSCDPARTAARLRKRFQLTKDKLATWARELGLLDAERE